VLCLAVRDKRWLTIDRVGRTVEEGDLEEIEEAEAAKSVIAWRTDDIDDSISGIGAILPLLGSLVGAVAESCCWTDCWYSRKRVSQEQVNWIIKSRAQVRAE
jgi:hypothetical protein